MIKPIAEDILLIPKVLSKYLDHVAEKHQIDIQDLLADMMMAFEVTYKEDTFFGKNNMKKETLTKHEYYEIGKIKILTTEETNKEEKKHTILTLEDYLDNKKE